MIHLLAQAQHTPASTVWDFIAPILQTLLGIAIISGVGFLWKISKAMGDLSTDVALIKQAQAHQGLDHGRRLDGLEEWKGDAQTKLDKVYLTINRDGSRSFQGG